MVDDPLKVLLVALKFVRQGFISKGQNTLSYALESRHPGNHQYTDVRWAQVQATTKNLYDKME